MTVELETWELATVGKGMIMNYTRVTDGGTTWTTGDNDDDENIDTVDLITVIINFTGAMNTAVAVFEPSNLLLLVLAIGCLSVEKRRAVVHKLKEQLGIEISISKTPTFVLEGYAV